MTKIVINGACGKLGTAVSAVAVSRSDCKVLAGIDISPVKRFDFTVHKSLSELTETPDVIIDASHPSCLDGILDYALTNGVALVLATTGYTPEQIEKIRSASQSVPIFFTANMSLDKSFKRACKKGSLGVRRSVRR